MTPSEQFEQTIAEHPFVATLRRYFEAVDARDVDRAVQCFARDGIVYRPDQTGSIQGREAIRQLIAGTLAPYSAFSTTIEDVFATGDRLCGRVSHQAIQKGSWKSRIGVIEADGVPVTLRAIAIMRFEDGLVAEEWICRDELGMLLQLGALRVT